MADREPTLFQDSSNAEQGGPSCNKTAEIQNFFFVLASFWLHFRNFSCVEKLYFMSFDVFCAFHMG